MRVLERAGLLAAIIALSGCVDASVFPDAAQPPGDSGPALKDGLLKGVVSLRIAPENAVLTIVDGKAASQTYKALGKLADGSERDVTAQASFSAADLRVGVFSGSAVFTSGVDRGGKTTITVEAGKLSATTSVTVIYQRRFLAAGVPADVESRLDKAPANNGREPTVAYPPDQVMLPPNLVEMEIQWLPGSGNDLFEVSVRSSGTDIRFYTKCTPVGAGCGLIPDEVAWKALVTALKGGEAATLVVRGTDAAGFTGAGASQGRLLRIAEEELQGGLYYWNATPGSIVRYDFGKAKQKATQFYTAADAKALICVGCHVMSRDGTRIAVGLDMPAPAPLKVLDVASRNLISAGAANFMTFSPDNQQIITSDGFSMVLREVATLTALAPNPLVALGTMPDWSADGKRVVFAAPKSGLPFPLPFGSPGISGGSLKMLTRDATGAWGAPTDLVPSTGENNYYPTFSPDDTWVVFNRAAGESYDAKDASLWMVRSDGSGKPISLKAADGGTTLCNSWPKFSPFIQKYGGGKLMWVTFSSRRTYGLRISDGRAQIWMAAIEPGKGEIGADPSHPAFWLPFQDSATGNHIAQWVSSVAQKPCVEDKECPGGEFCLKGICEPIGPD